MTIVVLKKLANTLLEAYKNYIDVFNEEKAGLLPDYGLYKLVIKLIKGK